MIKPRGRNGSGVIFPFIFEKNGRTGRIKKWSDGKFGTYFVFAGQPHRNSFRSFENAFQHLDREFSKLDSDKANALSLHPLNSDIRNYSELEELLRAEGNGATLREAVTFFLSHHQHQQFSPRKVEECTAVFIAHQKANNISISQIATLEKHYRRFNRDFGARKIHSISSLEMADWLIAQQDKNTGLAWSLKTRTSNLGSLVSLSLFARDTLKAIPDIGKTEFQKVRRPKKDQREEVEIYTPLEMGKLLLAALETDMDLLPALVAGGFEGLRPAEFHAEGAKRRPLTWESFIWNDSILHISGQKVRSRANRNIPFHAVSKEWLEPFQKCKGEIWAQKQAYTKKMIALRQRAGVRSIYDGLRHSYASYRIRDLKQNLQELAHEMGNSPREIVDSYKRNVSDVEANAWFSITPPPDYCEKVEACLRLGQPA